MYVTHQQINNPFETFSVLEPGKASGCETVRRATVKKSAEQKKCVVAMNAGMFNVTSDKCLGKFTLCVCVFHLWLVEYYKILCLY